MSKITAFCLAVIAVCSMFFAGCSNPEEEKAKANAALRAEVREILENIHIVEKAVLTSVDRGDIVNNDILIILDKYKRLCELTGISFYSWVLSEPNSPFLSSEQFKKLTEQNPKVIPFYVEDDISGNIYFAPPPEQEFIINKFKAWFAKNGETFDFYALQQARTKK
ncbi:MAG: hypothetical protein IKB77_04870 [Lentisphaeria bacterium]|nr:hypothetical protein [Lentisphaeria bacterium]